MALPFKHCFNCTNLNSRWSGLVSWSVSFLKKETDLYIVLVTLHDIVHTDKSLTLVFEYLERDLKQYMDDCGAILAMNNVKLFLYQVPCTALSQVAQGTV